MLPSMRVASEVTSWIPHSRSRSPGSPPAGFMIQHRTRVVKRHPEGDW
jgi:hypothetical protein